LRAIPFLAAAAFLAFASASVDAASSFDDGERLFRDNKPAEAAPVFEKAILEPGVDERAWLYLALSYQQLGRLDDASAALRKGPCDRCHEPVCQMRLFFCTALTIACCSAIVRAKGFSP